MVENEQTISSVDDLISRIISDTKSINEPIWYRGMAIQTWKLLPMFQRDNIKNIKLELEYLREFKQQAMLLADPMPTKSIEWLFLMRHHGVPTRLLDWTESPLAAAFFAVNDKKEFEKEVGIIWALRPIKLNQKIGSIKVITSLPSFDEDKKLMDNYLPKEEEGEPDNNMQPIAFLAPRNSERMQAQSSVFTISGDPKTEINSAVDKNHSWKYIIPTAIKKQIKSELKLIGINRFQLFPELDSINKQFEED